MFDWLYHGMSENMFALNIPLLEKILRPWIVYAFLVIALRLAGKRALAQINTFDLVVLLMLSNTVQNAIIGDDNSLTGGLIGAASLLVMNSFVVRLVFQYTKLDELLEGTPTPLIEHGKLQEQHMEREGVSESELTVAAHRQGFRNLDDIDKAELETSGSIAFIGKEQPSTDSQHHELLQRLDALSQQIKELQQALRPK